MVGTLSSVLMLLSVFCLMHELRKFPYSVDVSPCHVFVELGTDELGHATLSDVCARDIPYDSAREVDQTVDSGIDFDEVDGGSLVVLLPEEEYLGSLFRCIFPLSRYGFYERIDIFLAPNETGYREAMVLEECVLYSERESDCVGVRSRKENVSRIDIRGNISKSQGMKEFTKICHRDFSIAADVDPPEQCDIFGHMTMVT